MNRGIPGPPVHHHLLEFTQTHIHRVGDAIQPFHPLLSPFPPNPSSSQHQSLFQWVNSSHEVAKVLVSALASLLPKKSQGWSPWEWTGWVSKGIGSKLGLLHCRQILYQLSYEGRPWKICISSRCTAQWFIYTYICVWIYMCVCICIYISDSFPYRLLHYIDYSSLCYTVGPCWFSSVQSLSRVWLFATPWIAACQASLSITDSQSLLRLMSIELVMPSSHLILCCPLLLLPPVLPSIRVFSNESALRMRWPKYWSFSFNISPSNEYSGLISFRMDWLDLCSPRDSQVFSNTTVQKHQFFGAQLSSQSNSHIHTWPLEKP